MLNQLTIKNAKPVDKLYSLADKDGLFLRVKPTGIKQWYISKNVKTQRISKIIGTFPEMSLKEARDTLAQLVAQVQTQSTPKIKAPTLKEVFDEWFEVKQTRIKNHRQIKGRFELYIFPTLADVQFSLITPMQIIDILKQKCLKSGKYETIKRICGPIKELEVFALNCGYIDALKLQNLQSVFPSPNSAKEHMPSVHWNDLPEVFKQLQVSAVLSRNVLPVILTGFYTLLRPIEYCALEWQWVDLDEGVITVPAEVMKMKKAHRVPISSQLRTILEMQPKISKYVFPSPVDLTKHYNRDTVSKFLRNHGFKGQLVSHGIRSIGRTWMHDNDVPFDVAELCLAHTVGTSTTRAYDRSDLLEKRREAMQKWCDYVKSCLI